MKHHRYNRDKIFVASLTHKLFARSIAREDRKKKTTKYLFAVKSFGTHLQGVLKLSSGVLLNML